MHILTYATHNEKYFPHLANNKEIIFLGFGKKWDGFRDKVRSVMEYAKTCQSNELLLFIDGFDSIILSDSNKIEKRYHELQSKYDFDIVFSKDSNANHKVTKMLQDKYFGTCNKLHINSGLYMGSAASIIEFWSPFVNDKNIKHDNQIYATNQCRTKYNLKMHIDTNNEIFFNFSNGDEELFKYQNNKVFTESSKYDVLILSAPGKENIDTILEKLNIEPLKVDKENSKMSLKKIYMSIDKHEHNFVFEITLLLILLYTLFSTNKILRKHLLTISIRYWIYMLLIITFLTYIEYVSFIRNETLSFFDKASYLLIDFFHIFVVFFSYLLIYLVFTQKHKINYLLILNIKYFIVLLLFFIYKKCILTMLSSNIIKQDIKFSPIYDRVRYLTDSNYSNDHSSNKEVSLHAWINGNKFLVSVLIATNIYVLYTYNRRN